MTYTEAALNFEKRRQDILGVRWIVGLSLALWAVAAGAAWLVL